jgi:hypothetical protein
VGERRHSVLHRGSRGLALRRALEQRKDFGQARFGSAPTGFKQIGHGVGVPQANAPLEQQRDVNHALAGHTRGLGARATITLRDAAASAGLRWLYGSVLADNAPMLALVQRCGFLCTPNRRDPGLVGIELQLDREPALLCTPPAVPSRWRWSLPRHACSHSF